MGIISSKYLKNQVQAEKLGDWSSVWRDRLQEFINKGGCKETFTSFQDCVNEAEEKNKPAIECYAKLQKCMEAHSDYYRPFLEAQQTDAQLFMKGGFMPLVENEEEKEEKYIAFMRGGGCKEPYMAWHNCIEEAEKNKEHSVTCLELGSKITKCLEAHSDYYHPILAATKTVEEQFMKDIQAFLSKEH